MLKGDHMEKLFLADNIRTLRDFFGETQAELADILNASSNAISNYENGIRTPDAGLVQNIANHFGLPADELLYVDLSFLRPLRNRNNYGFQYVEYLFPIIASDEALNNKLFCDAYKLHKKIYEELKVNPERFFDNFDVENLELYEMYYGAYNDDHIDEAGLNMVCLCQLIYLALITTTESLKNKDAVLYQAQKDNPRITKLINSNNDQLHVDVQELLAEFTEMDDNLLEVLKEMIKNGKYSDLSHYLLAMRYFVGMGDDIHTLLWKRRISIEMIDSLALVGNKYAKTAIDYLMNNNIEMRNED